jgi:hypothetical protein
MNADPRQRTATARDANATPTGRTAAVDTIRRRLLASALETSHEPALMNVLVGALEPTPRRS